MIQAAQFTFVGRKKLVQQQRVSITQLLAYAGSHDQIRHFRRGNISISPGGPDQTGVSPGKGDKECSVMQHLSRIVLDEDISSFRCVHNQRLQIQCPPLAGVTRRNHNRMRYS